MNIAKPVSTQISNVVFSFYDPQEVRNISVKQIVNPILLDNLQRPTRGGLYDPALGPLKGADLCDTCKLDYFSCPGHFGHIEFPVAVVNPLLFGQVYALLRAKCFHCNQFKLSRLQMARFVARLRLIKQGLVLAAVEVATMDVVILEDNDNEPQEEAMNTDDEEMDAERAKAAKTRTESEDDVIDRVNAFVTRTLQQDTIRSTEATTLINEERRRTIQEFFRKCVARLTCEKCRAQTIKLRKEGKSKIFEVPLSQKQLDKMAREGKQLHDILVTAVMEKRPTKTAQQDSEEDSSEEEEEEETQPIKMVKGTQQRQSSKLLTPLHIQQHLKVLFDKEQSLVDLLYARPTEQHANHNMFFIQVLAVSPTRFRPPAEQQGVLMENAQNVHLSKILGVCTRIRELNASESVNKDEVHIPADTRFEQLIVEWVKLQEHVNHYLDSEKGDGKLPPGIKQILEKKQGLFRMHMMGKRVNFAARSVISPDPNIETSEIGIPPVFAAKLTYPEPVTQYNIHEMRQAVINGAKWPGASHVQMENGELMSLNKLSLEQRTALANTLMTPTDLTLTQTPINKKVFRHLRNGDYLLLNRQPTLHKPSIMAHRARVLPGEKTIRLHYANCNTYNADFDGDEMNVHFPQNELGRAEAALIAATDYQYLVPTSGAPLRGLIQDHVVAGVWMTSRDTFFERDEMMQVVYGALQPENDATLGGGRLRILPPAMHKPKYLWTGKQIISILLLNMTWDHPPPNIVSKSQTPGRYWGKAAMEEAEVIVLNGELVQGVLDKAQFGAKAYGLVHSFYELYGPAMAGKLLSALGRLFTKFLQSRAFTCRMDDLRLTEQGDAWRRDLLHNGRAFGFNTAQDYVGLPSTAQVAPHHLSKEFTKRMEEVIREDEKMQGLDAAMKSKMNELTSSIIGKCLPDGLLIKFPDNNMQMMTVSGAKGSNVNVSQISCCLGQQELEGRRVPIMISGKSLPSFLPFDPTAKAGGFIASRFLTGVKPQEYFFHCMAGREGLIDTAVKTSRSGYLQRCLIKHLEGLRVHYDHTVRDADGSVLQFHYGEDALDVTKQKHLTQFAFVAQNFHIFNARLNPAAAAAVVDDEKAAEWNDLVKKEPDTHDPTMSLYSPSRYLRSTSESFQKALTQYTKNNPDDLLSVKKKPAKHNPSIQNLSGTKFRALMNLKYMQSLVEPGEAVGLLAAQGIGEPSTQMTLNTFHFAGFGAKNVTLGIPRLREIVMTASQSIKTPTMTLPLLSHVTQQDADALAKRMTKLTLAEVVDYVKVTERLAVEGGAGFKQYTVHLHFFPQQDYTDEYNIQPSDLEEVVERDFARKLYMMLTRELKMKLSARVVVDESNEGTDIGHAVKKTRTDGDGDSDVDSDADLPPRPVDASDDESDVDADDQESRPARRTMASYEMVDDEAKEKDSSSDSDSDDSDKGDAMEVDETTEQQERLGRITANTNFICGYRFDTNNKEWCELDLQLPINSRKLLMVDIVEKVCHQSVIRHIPRINRCFVSTESPQDTRLQLMTEGENLQGVHEFADTIDVNQVYSNDIAAILRIYGVEAARSALIKEIAGVFGVYGIQVDTRHLTLVADYMTFDGGYRPFNRIGIEGNASPFAKMSFETTMHFLTKATTYGEIDTLKNPSARLVVGKVVESGTGAIDILQPFVVEKVNT